MKVSKFLMALIIGLVLFSVGCSKDEESKGEVNKTASDLPEFTFEKGVFPPSPKGIVKVNGNEYDMMAGGFEWSKGNKHIQTDAMSPSQIAEIMDAIELESGSEVRIEIEQNPKLHLFLWEGEENAKSVQLNENQLTFSESEGRYIYEVRAKWENGEVSYTFVVDVK